MSATKVSTQITTHGNTCVVICLDYRDDQVIVHIDPADAVKMGEHMQYLVTELRAARRPRVSLTTMSGYAIIGASFHSEHPDEDPAVDPYVLLEVEHVGQDTDLGGVLLTPDDAAWVADQLIAKGRPLLRG